MKPIKALMAALLLSIATLAGAQTPNPDSVAWANQIRHKINATVVVPTDTPKYARVVCKVKQLENGEVTEAIIAASSGIKAVDAAIVKAIYRASPLPLAPKPEMFEPEIQIVWKLNE